MQRPTTHRSIRLCTVWVAIVLISAPLARSGAGTPEAAPPDPDLRTEGMRRAGPILFRPYLDLRELGYDDNIFYDNDLAVGPCTPEDTRGCGPIGDTVARLAPGLDLLIRTGHRGGIFLSQELEYAAYRTYTELNAWNGRFRGRWLFLTQPMLFSLEESFESVFERPNLEIDERIRQKNNAITAAARTLDRGGRLGVELLLRRKRFDYESNNPESQIVSNRLSRDEGLLSAIGTLRVLPKTTLTLEGWVARAQFDPPNENRDSRAIALVPGVRFDKTAAIQGHLALGYMSFVAPNQPDSDYRGLIGSGLISSRIGRFGIVRGTFDRELEFSALSTGLPAPAPETALYYISTRWSAAYEQFFSRSISAEVLYGRGLNHYPQEVLLLTPEPEVGIRNDRFTRYGLELRYRVRGGLSFSAVANRLVRSSTDVRADLTVNRYFIGSEYVF